MPGWRKRSTILIMVVALVFSTTGFPALAKDGTFEDEPTGEAMIADFVALRPLGIGATVVGTAFFVVTLPFSVLGKNTDAAWEKMVKDPFVFTFARPLGEVD